MLSSPSTEVPAVWLLIHSQVCFTCFQIFRVYFLNLISFYNDMIYTVPESNMQSKTHSEESVLSPSLCSFLLLSSKLFAPLFILPLKICKHRYVGTCTHMFLYGVWCNPTCRVLLSLCLPAETDLGRSCQDWCLGFPGDSVVKNPSASPGDTGLIPNPGSFHNLWGN